MKLNCWPQLLQSRNGDLIYLVDLLWLGLITSLKFLLEQRIATPTQQKWLAKLLGYAFVVKYKKGIDNRVADALS